MIIAIFNGAHDAAAIPSPPAPEGWSTGRIVHGRLDILETVAGLAAETVATDASRWSGDAADSRVVSLARAGEPRNGRAWRRR
jgi:hypothetical protein